MGPSPQPLVDPNVLPVPLFLLVLVLAGAAAGVAALPSFARALAGLSVRARVGVLLALGAGAGVRFLLPDRFFHEDFYFPIILDHVRHAQVMDVPFGKGFAAIHDAVLRLGGGNEAAIFRVQRWMGLGGVLAAAVLAHVLLADGIAAFAAALLFALNPILARLSASEDPAAPFGFLLLSGTAALLLLAREDRRGAWAAAQRVALGGYTGCALALMANQRTDAAAYLLVTAALVAAAPGAARALARRPEAWVAAALAGAGVAVVVPEVLSPVTGGFRLATDPRGWVQGVAAAWDFREPNRVVLFAQGVTPPLVPVLWLAGLVGLGRERPRLALALGVPIAIAVPFFLGTYGFPGNVRYQAPYHHVVLLAAAAGASWLVRSLFDGARARAAAIVGLALAAGLSYASTIRELARARSPHEEWGFLTWALETPRFGPDPVFVRAEGGRDTPGVNTTFPDFRVRSGQVRGSLMSIGEFLDRGAPPGANVVYYRGLSCHLAGAFEGDQARRRDPCGELEARFRIEPVFEQHHRNVPYEAMFRYPPEREVPTLRLGFYRVLGPREAAGP